MVELPPLPNDLPSDPLATYVPPTSARAFPPLSAGAGVELGVDPPAGVATFELSRWSLARPAALDVAETDGAPGDADAVPSAGAAAPSYQLLRQVARGGMGEVWEAWQESLGRVVAVKRTRSDYLERLRAAKEPKEAELALAEFRVEAAMAARLEHPNIVPVHDLGADAEGLPLLAMKLVKGEPWHKLIAADFRSLPSADFLARHVPILADVAQAVAFAHARGVVHRDLKPAQVMVGEFGETLLMDWGLAIEIDPDAAMASRSAPRAPTPSTASNPAGTPALMAPEQTERDAKNVGPWTDVYLLGATLYFLLTGTYPHSAKTSAQSMMLARAGVVAPPAERAPERHPPAELASLCMKAMAREIGDRVASASAFVAALNDYFTGATRRRESNDLARRAANELEAGASLGYAQLSSCQETLSRAQALWPENELLPRLFDRACLLHAERALASGDLTLARSQAERATAGEPRSHLLARVAARARRNEALARQRRLLMAGFAALAAAVIAGLAWFSWAIGEKNAGLDAANARLADEERQTRRLLAVTMNRTKSGQELVGFLMQGLRQSLDSADPEDNATIDLIGEEVMRHYRELDFSADTPEMRGGQARSLLDAVGVMRNWSRLEEAEELTSMVMEMVLADPPLDESWRAAALNALGQLRMEQGRYEEAEGHLREALASHEASFGPDHKNVAISLNNLGAMYNRLGRNDEAMKYFDRAIAIQEKVDPENEEEASLIAFALSNAGLARREMGRPDLGEPLLRRALEINVSFFGESHEYVGRVCANLALCLSDMGRHEEADDALRRAEAIYLKAYGEEFPEVARIRGNRGSMMIDRGMVEEGEALVRQAVESLERTLGSHPDTAAQLWTLGHLLYERGEYDEAMRLQRRALEMRLAAFGPANDLVAATKLDIALLHDKQGDRAAARALAEEALSTLNEFFGPTDFRSATIRIVFANKLRMPELAGLPADTELPIPIPGMEEFLATGVVPDVEAGEEPNPEASEAPADENANADEGATKAPTSVDDSATAHSGHASTP